MADDSKDPKKEEREIMDDLQKQIQELEKEDKKVQKEEEENIEKGDLKDAKINELTDALARAMADLQNYKRRNEEDRGRFAKFANIELLKTLLPTLDNLIVVLIIFLKI